MSTQGEREQQMNMQCGGLCFMKYFEYFPSKIIQKKSSKWIIIVMLTTYVEEYLERENKQTTLEPHKIFKLKITIGKEIQHSTQPHK